MRTLYTLFTLGGISALIYEVMWAREFRSIFGNSTRSASVVLAAYFGGLAIGNLIGARLARRGDPVRLYGITEILVGLSAVLVGAWLTFYESLYPALYQATGGQSGLLILAELILAFFALGPPTIAMGATWPLMARAAVQTADHVARRTGLLYAVNVIGGAAGILLAGFVTPIWLGVRNTILVAVAVNLLIGIIAWLISHRQSYATIQIAPQTGQASSPNQRSRGWLASVILAAAISGYGVLSLEVLYTRMLSQRSRGSVYAFALMLLIVLLSLAAGALLVAIRLDRNRPWRFLAWTQMAAVVAILVSPLTFQFLSTVTAVFQPASYESGLLLLSVASLMMLGPAMVLVGVLLPSLWKIVGTDVISLGSDVGKLTALNTIAAVAGALVTGFVCLPRLGLSASFLLVAGLYATVAMIAWWHAYAGVKRWSGVAACAAIVTTWFFAGVWDVNFQTLEPGATLVHYKDGEAATVAVIQHQNGHRTLTTNQNYILGSTGAAGREIRQGRLPLLLHPEPKRVAFIGVATGLTVSGALDFPVEEVDALELIPGVADVAREFEAWNRKCFDDSRFHLVVADGRNHLLGTAAHYDVIVSDLFVPWHAGTGDMYTVEHFRTCRERLAAGGLFAQWLPGYQLTVEELRIITASFLEVFPATTLWRNDFHSTQPIVCLIGYPDASELRLDGAAVNASCQRLAQRGPRATYLDTPDGLKLLFVAGDADLRQWVRGATLNTDDRPIIEYCTPRSVFEHRQQRQVRQVLDLLASFRPRDWPYQEPLVTQRTDSDIFAAADLMHDALIAGSEDNYAKQFRLAKQLVDRAGDVSAVAHYVIDVASRQRQRQMTERGTELLTALVAKSKDSVGPLLLLAQVKRLDGEDDEAITLFQRVVELAPEQIAVRRTLVELMTAAGQFAECEPHLRELVEATPEDAELRLELANVLHRQGNKSEAAEQIEVFRKLDMGDQRAQLWSRLRTFGLGAYIDRPALIDSENVAPQQEPRGDTDGNDQ